MTRRIRAVGEAAVPDWVAREARKFEYPDFDTIGPAAQPGGGGGAPSIVVAASNATDLSKSKADFVCTGIDDHTVIQQALDGLDTGIDGGGRLLLTEGIFNVDGDHIRTSDVTALAPVQIEGMGMATRLVMQSAGTCIELNSDGSMVRNLRISGEFAGDTGIEIDSGNEQFWVQSVWIEDLNGAGIAVSSGTDEVFIQNCFINATLHGVVVASQTEHAVISDNYITVDEDGVVINDSDDIVVANNNVEGTRGIVVNDTQFIVIADNNIDTSGGLAILCNVDSTEHGPVVISGNACQSGGISLAMQFAFQVTANTVYNVTSDSGVAVAGCFEGSVRANDIHFPAEHGIILDADCEKIDVLGNLIVEPGSATANTYDGIQTSADIGLILGNHIVPNATTSTRYGINIAAGSDNAVFANFLGDSSVYGTADSIDSGTNTILAAATGAIGGQFAY